MATSTLTLYINSGMKQENNYIVEYIGQYLRLNAEGSRAIENFQYIKNPASPQAFKVNIPQDEYNNSVVDYASLLQDGDMYYYFIVDAKWTSQNCLTLMAVLDTLNTFQDQYSLTDRSNIERQHVDRVKLIGERPTGDSINEVVTNVISTTREELQPEMLMTRNEVLSGDLPIDTRYQWYLIYQTNTDTGNPEILMCANKDIRLSGEPTTQEYILNVAKMKESSYMIFDRCTIEYNDNQSSQTYTIDIDGMIGFYQTPSDSNTFKFTYYPKDGSAPKVNQITSLVKIRASNTCKLYSVNTVIFDRDAIAGSSYILLGAPDTLTGIESIDRTRSNLYKVIECPYCPLDINITEGSMPTLPDKWSFDSERGKFVCSDLTYEFPERVAWTEENVMNIIAGQVIKAQRAKLSQYSRKDHQDGVEGNVVDPKTYISTLRSWNFVYDAVTWSLIPEDLVIPNKNPRPDLIKMYYKQSNNISSDCGFRFDIPEFTMQHRQYFDQYMFSARSNELPLYSSDYINYMRNGYNYDLKANRLKSWSDIFGLAGQGLGFATYATTMYGKNQGIQAEMTKTQNNIRNMSVHAGYGAPVGGYINSSIGRDAYIGRDITREINKLDSLRMQSLNSFAFPSLVSSGVGLITGIANAGISHAQREQALEQKINEYKNRAFSVSSTGNHDLFKWYSGNKVILFEFEPREEVRELINDFFSLFGYAQGYYMVPDLDSRLWFNYCRGTVDIDNYKKKRSLEENKADIVQRFQQGVYKIHRVNTPLGTFWDMKLERQNYERAILPESWCR